MQYRIAHTPKKRRWFLQTYKNLVKTESDFGSDLDAFALSNGFSNAPKVWSMPSWAPVCSWARPVKKTIGLGLFENRVYTPKLQWTISMRERDIYIYIHSYNNNKWDENNDNDNNKSNSMTVVVIYNYLSPCFKWSCGGHPLFPEKLYI